MAKEITTCPECDSGQVKEEIGGYRWCMACGHVFQVCPQCEANAVVVYANGEKRCEDCNNSWWI